ncbi:hypothetical protein RKE29_28400 [Streptomyces sp. B1866]|uniref:DNA polymerase Y family protein n=1 Tax=Streptomyces sp. B1866 TaxID=3075431 RepID=UPI00288DA853|nr:hypothetical protein [Streptomyces sp. B1866]MDT3400483.1 hypothetical protein [Streptomyces sp. B1866]
MSPRPYAGPYAGPDSGPYAEPEPDRGPYAGGGGDPSGARVLYVRFAGPGEARYPALLRLLADITPAVQALPPDAALADVRGACRYFRRDAAGLAALVRLRAVALYGVDCAIGVAPNPLLAALAAHRTPPGTVRTLTGRPAETAAFLDRQPVAALPGLDPAAARTLAGYGLHTVGALARVPPPTLRRILGPAAGPLHDQARGVDPRPVTPGAPAPDVRARCAFGRDETDPARHRRALLALADDLGARLRAARREARVLTLTVQYADRSATTRTRPLPGSTAHTRDLAAAAYRLHASLALQRARVRALLLCAQDLAPDGTGPRQLSLDPGEEKARRAERTADRARARYGPAAARPAALAGPGQPAAAPAPAPGDACGDAHGHRGAAAG